MGKWTGLSDQRARPKVAKCGPVSIIDTQWPPVQAILYYFQYVHSNCLSCLSPLLLKVTMQLFSDR